MLLGVVAELIGKLAFLVVIGYILRKTGVIDDAFQKKLSTILVNVVLPFGIIAVGNNAYDPAMASPLLWSALIIALVYAVSYALMLPLSRALPIVKDNKNLFANLVVLSNVAYIGFPVIAALYGTEGSMYAVIYNLIFPLCAYSVGVALMGDRITLKRLIFRPLVLAAVLAILIFISPFRLPAVVIETFDQVGGLSAALAMFIIGSSVAKIPFRTLWTDGWAWLTTALGQVVQPLIVAVILWLAGFSGVMPSVVVVLTGLPAGATNIIFAEQFDRDTLFTTRSMVQGTILMVATLPLTVWLCSVMF